MVPNESFKGNLTSNSKTAKPKRKSCLKPPSGVAEVHQPPAPVIVFCAGGQVTFNDSRLLGQVHQHLLIQGSHRGVHVLGQLLPDLLHDVRLGQGMAEKLSPTIHRWRGYHRFIDHQGRTGKKESGDGLLVWILHGFFLLYLVYLVCGKVSELQRQLAMWCYVKELSRQSAQVLLLAAMQFLPTIVRKSWFGSWIEVDESQGLLPTPPSAIEANGDIENGNLNTIYPWRIH